MKKIHFYKDTELVYSVYANSLDEVRGNPEAYYKEFKNKMIISEIEYTHPILEDETLREATRDELVAKGLEINLEEGEVIKRKKIIKIERPSQHHIWTGSEWIVDLEELKKTKREELKKIRDEKVHSNIKVHGEIFQVREADKEHFDDVDWAVKRGHKTEQDSRPWILANNEVKIFTYGQILQVIDEKAKRKDVIFAKFGELSVKLEACNTVAEIEAIKWD